MVKTVKVGTLDFNWVWTLSSAIINFYELKRARSASLVPQTETKRSYRHLNCFLPLALSVMLRTNPSLRGEWKFNHIGRFSVCDSLWI